MIDYVLLSLSDLLEYYDGAELNNMFRSFSCKNEHDLEVFLLEKAIRYEESDIGRTFIFANKPIYEQYGDIEVLAYFTLSHTSVDLTDAGQNKKKDVVGCYPNRDSLNTFPAFLIGQIGRSDTCTSEELPGEQILNECYTILKGVSNSIGGKLVVLECRKHMFEKVYSRHGFKKLSENLNKNGLYMLYQRIQF